MSDEVILHLHRKLMRKCHRFSAFCCQILQSCVCVSCREICGAGKNVIGGIFHGPMKNDGAKKFEPFCKGDEDGMRSEK